MAVLIMTCLPTLATGQLGYFFVPTAPSGTIPSLTTAYNSGAGNGNDNPPTPLTLDLQRTDRDTGSALTVNAGYTTEPLPWVKNAYNGAGTEALTGLSLAASGDGVTVAVRFWLGGGAVQGGSQPAKSIQFFGLSGQSAANPTVEDGISVVCPDPTAGSPELALRNYNGGSPTETVFGGPLPATDQPFLLVVTFARGPSSVTATAYIDGAALGDPVDLIDPADFDLLLLTVGDAVESDGAFSQAAVWDRALTPAEVASMGTSLDCLPSLPPTGGGGSGSGDPLLHPDGTHAVCPEWVVPRTDLVGVLASGGPRREARRTHERVPRVYDLNWSRATADEMERIRQACEITRGGAYWTRYRVPGDDAAGPVASAPRWRIVNASEAIALTRNRGGASARVTLVIEEVV